MICVKSLDYSLRLSNNFSFFTLLFVLFIKVPLNFEFEQDKLLFRFWLLWGDARGYAFCCPPRLGFSFAFNIRSVWWRIPLRIMLCFSYITVRCSRISAKNGSEIMCFSHEFSCRFWRFASLANGVPAVKCTPALDGNGLH